MGEPLTHSPTSQVEAASALANLARDNEQTQQLIFKAGGIGPLLAMLPARSEKAQASAAPCRGAKGGEPQDGIPRDPRGWG